ncbi:MAG: HEAT repeat domain-containing protein [Candidatus Wallbacteria bacterium]|nr:HEAT repeat domain-containing protein [Candidatus Wallbacteria bacterium]
MRQQDKLLEGLAQDDPAWRAFVARRLERVQLHFDGEDLVETVRQAALQIAGTLPNHFFCALTDLLPRQARARYAPDPGPVRSHLVKTRTKPAAPDSTAAQGREAVTRSASQLLEPCVAPAVAASRDATGPGRRRILGALGRLRHSAATAHLEARLEDSKDAPYAALILSSCTGLADPATFVRRVERLWAGGEQPHFILSLRYAPCEESLALLRAASNHRSPTVQWLAAACLDRFGKLDVSAPLAQLSEAGGWAALHALESAARLSRPELAFDCATRALRAHTHPLVRAAALRSLIAAGTPQAAELCLSELSATGSSVVRAQAVSALAQLDLPAGVRARTLAPLLKSESLEVVTQAILGLIGADDQRAGRAIRDLIVDGDEDERIAAAYCLGYYPGKSSLQVLEHLIRTDGAKSVRIQATRALACYEKTPEVTRLLLALLEHEDSSIVSDAVRILASPETQESSEAAAAALAAARRAPPGPAARIAHRALGRFTARACRAYVSELLSRSDTGPDALLGAVDALAFTFAQPPDPEPLQRLLSDSRPAVRAAAARTLWTWGDPGGIPTLARDLAAPADVATYAADALEEMALISQRLLDTPRLAPLAEHLRANLKTSAYLDFARRELGLAVSPPAEPAAIDEHAVVLSRSSWKADDLGGEPAAKVLAQVEESRRRPAAAGRRAHSKPTREMAALEGLEMAAPGKRSRHLFAAAGGIAIGLLCSFLFFGRKPSEPLEPLAPDASAAAETAGLPMALKVVSMRGTFRIKGGPPDQPLAPERKLAPGQSLSVDPGGAVWLGLAPEGNVLGLPAAGGFELEELRTAADDPDSVSLRLSGLEGRVVFDLKWGRPKVTLALGRASVRGWRGLYAVEDQAGTITVLVAFGRVEVLDPSGRPTLVTEGRKAVLRRGQEQLEVGVFDPATQTWR